MHICESGDSLITEHPYFRYGLNQTLNHCLALIQTHLFKEATFVNQSREITIQDFVIPSSTRIIEVTDNELLKVFPHYTADHLESVDGVYSSEYGKVLLCKGRWCISTIIHETLHACSITGIASNDIEPIVPLYEGLTELYTGYILFKEFNTSYSYCWMGDTDVICRLSYSDPTGVWGTFCHLIRIQETYPIYFYAGSQDWRGQFDLLVERIHDLGYQHFKNPLNMPLNQPSYLKLYDQCRKIFGEKKCDRYYRNADLSLDFATILTE